MKLHTIGTASGVGLHAREFGNPNGIPILFIHGWSQCHLSWAKQFEGPLADEARLIAFDLRGHGMSDAPAEAEAYTDGDRWADDIAGIIGTLHLDRVILVGWSYGGFVMADYLRRHGETKIAGINFVDAAVVLGPKAFGTLLGAGFLEHAPGACAQDLPTNIAAMRNFLRACTAKPIEQSAFEEILAFNMVVRPAVRAALIQRALDFTPILRELTVPVLVTHGRLDRVVLPAMAELILGCCKTARAAWFDGSGHAPFLEDAARFNMELRDFARGAAAR